MYILYSVGASVVPWLPIVGAAFGLYLYYPLFTRTRDAGISLNIATFVLWGFLDGIAAGSSYLDGGFWALPFAYSIGSFAVGYAIYCTGTWKWTLREKLAASFVVISMTAWLFVSNEWAILLSTTGAVAAGIPLLLDTWEEPEEAPLDIYIGIWIANALGLVPLATGIDFSVEHHFYPAACVALTTTYVIAAMSKWTRRAAT